MSSEQPPTPQYNPQPDQNQPGQYPPGQYQQQPGQQQPTETTAVLGFTFGFLFWPVGLILSIIATKTIKRTGAGGKGLAIAGLIVSIVMALGTGALIVTSVLAVKSAVDTVSKPLDDLGKIPSLTTETDSATSDPNSDSGTGFKATSVDEVDNVLMGVIVDGDVYKATNGTFPTDISQVPGTDTHGVDVTFFPVSDSDYCAQGTIDGGKITRSITLSDIHTKDGPCEG